MESLWDLMVYTERAAPWGPDALWRGMQSQSLLEKPLLQWAKVITETRDFQSAENKELLNV